MLMYTMYTLCHIHTQEYGTDSLLSSAMSAWQGPSLMVYNDATFTDRDFHNLARIGQASKLDKLSTTGKQ
jgi:sacsin